MLVNATESNLTRADYSTQRMQYAVGVASVFVGYVLIAFLFSRWVVSRGGGA